MDQQPSPPYSHITCEIDRTIMAITLNRPDKLNAYTGAMGSEIEAAFRKADADDDVRAIIVTGAGRAFCAGADVSGGAASFDTSGEHGADVFGNRLASGS
jgi:enoyl-CoA hydratase/carnithine racemase